MNAHDDAMPLDLTDADTLDLERPRHGRTCSSDPEIGCECGLADWVGDGGFATLQEAWDAELARAAQVMADDIDRHLGWSPT